MAGSIELNFAVLIRLVLLLEHKILEHWNMCRRTGIMS